MIKADLILKMFFLGKKQVAIHKQKKKGWSYWSQGMLSPFMQVEDSGTQDGNQYHQDTPLGLGVAGGDGFGQRFFEANGEVREQRRATTGLLIPLRRRHCTCT